jgi:hypothetical protein
VFKLFKPLLAVAVLVPIALSLSLGSAASATTSLVRPETASASQDGVTLNVIGNLQYVSVMVVSYDGTGGCNPIVMHIAGPDGQEFEYSLTAKNVCYMGPDPTHTFTFDEEMTPGEYCAYYQVKSVRFQRPCVNIDSN